LAKAILLPLYINQCGHQTGECAKRRNDISGIAVHLASRLLDHAGAGDVIVSSTVKDLVVGSGVTFKARGEAILRDVPGSWQIYAATEAG